jgi:CRP-like cAMP-binding protein
MGSSDAVVVPLLAVLSDKDRAKVLANARTRTFTPGETVVRQGESALNLFIVRSGHARVERDEQAVGTRLGPGDFFGELALIEEHARTATIVAEDELTCYLIPAWEFRSLLKEHPAMALPMLEAVIARLHGREHHPR